MLFLCNTQLYQLSCFQVSVANGNLMFDVGRLFYTPSYNCSELASSCSSCLALNFSTNFGFECNWCTRLGDQETMCLDSEECNPNSLPMSGIADRCPPPVIRYICNYTRLDNYNVKSML